MTTTPDPKKVREIARSAFGYLPHDYVRARLVQAAIAEHGIDEHDVPTWSAYFNAAEADLAGAVVSWPDEQSQDEPARPRLFTDIDCDTNPPLRVRAFVNAAMQTPDTNGMGIASVIDSDGVMYVLTEQDLVDVLDDLDETREEFDQLFGKRAKEQPQDERDGVLNAANDLRAWLNSREGEDQLGRDVLGVLNSREAWRNLAWRLEQERDTWRSEAERRSAERNASVRRVGVLRAWLYELGHNPNAVDERLQRDAKAEG